MVEMCRVSVKMALGYLTIILVLVFNNYFEWSSYNLNWKSTFRHDLDRGFKDQVQTNLYLHRFMMHLLKPMKVVCRLFLKANFMYQTYLSKLKIVPNVGTSFTRQFFWNKVLLQVHQNKIDWLEAEAAWNIPSEILNE